MNLNVGMQSPRSNSSPKLAMPLIEFTISSSVMPSITKRSTLDATQLMRRAEDLINAASNRYRITVQVANRAQRRRYEEFDNLDDPKMKPVIRAIIEMSDELTQPEIIGE
jgi:DNA-directed RNA polymerase subunit omega